MVHGITYKQLHILSIKLSDCIIQSNMISCLLYKGTKYVNYISLYLKSVTVLGKRNGNYVKTGLFNVKLRHDKQDADALPSFLHRKYNINYLLLP